MTPITKGDYDVIQLVKFDIENGWLYFIASPENPAQRYLFGRRVGGTGTAEQLSPANQKGTYAYRFSGDSRRAFNSFSNANTPPIYDLAELPSHRVIHTFQDNSEAMTKMQERNFRHTSFFNIDIGDGVELPSYIIKPYNFESSKKYPVLFYVCGESAGPTVRDVWRGNLWYQYLAQRGYIIISIDNRGTSTPLGREWRHFLHYNIGIYSSDEFI